MSRSERYCVTISRDDAGRISDIKLSVTPLDDEPRTVHVTGYHLGYVTTPVQQVLRGAHIGGRQWTTPGPLELAAGPGAHLELLLRAVKPLRRVDRIGAVADGIADMSTEESAYWHAQTFRRRGLPALRILVDGGTKP